MKTKNVISAFVMTGTVITLAFAGGCGNSSDSAVETESINITFMNQDESLGTVQTNAGEVLDRDLYESYETFDAGEFNGWYETPTFLESSKKDPSTDSFEKDTTLYGDFRADEVAEDTRLWYIAGISDFGSLKLNNWAADLSDEEKVQFQLQPTGENVNEFSITIDLFAGDQFQIIHDWSWNGQKGYGKFTDIDDTQMENAGGLGGTDDTSNISVLQDGNYTITLTTNPDNEAQDTLSIVRNSDPVNGAE